MGRCRVQHPMVSYPCEPCGARAHAAGLAGVVVRVCTGWAHEGGRRRRRGRGRGRRCRRILLCARRAFSRRRGDRRACLIEPCTPTRAKEMEHMMRDFSLDRRTPRVARRAARATSRVTHDVRTQRTILLEIRACTLERRIGVLSLRSPQLKAGYEVKLLTS